MISIYIIRNSINDKVYIGQTVKPISRRFNLHKAGALRGDNGCLKLSRAIVKHGAINFSVHLLDAATTPDEADRLEIHYISLYDSAASGYNISFGGRGYNQSVALETGRKISKAKKGRPLQPLEERFWSKVDKTSDCWLWCGTIHHHKGNKKEGVLNIAGKMISVNRVCYELTCGPIPVGHSVRRSCGNALCVNPAHLFLS